MPILSLIVLCLLFLSSAQAMAQTKSAPQKPTPAPKAAAGTPTPAPAANPGQGPNQAPQITTTVFGDWALQCQKIAENGNHLCQISLTIKQSNQDAPIAQMVIGRQAGKPGTQLVVLLPNNISFPSSVQVRSDSKDLSGLDVPWQRCVPGACLAGTTLTDADVVRWHALDNPGRITFKDSQTNEVGIEFSFHGLGQALDAMNQQAE
jgi:invasion protein IalB